MFKFRFRTKVQCPVNLRFDDTNPKKSREYVDAIKEDLVWLDLLDQERYSSDYFQQLYDWSVEMIKTIKLM
jgi:glutaminyl-tRNA synthetase